MKNRVLICLSLLCILLMGATELYRHKYKMSERQLTESKNTVSALMVGMEELKSDTTGKAKQVCVLTLSLEDYKRMKAEDAELIKSLQLKLKHLASVSKQNVAVDIPIATPVVDTVVVKEYVRDTIQKVVLVDKYMAFEGVLENDSLKANINIPITLFQTVHKIPKHKFLWWKWGCKGFKQVITTDNPYANITYSEYINIR